MDCAPLRDGGGIEGADGRPSACVEIVGGVAVEKSFPHGRVRFRPAGLWPRRRPSGSSVGGESGADASRGFVLESTSRGGVRQGMMPASAPSAAITLTRKLRSARRRSTRPPSSPPSASSRTRTATSDIRDMLRIPGGSRVRPTSYSGRSRRGFLRLSCELRFKRYRSNSMRLNLPVREVKVIRGFAPLLRDPTGHIMMRSARAAPRYVVRVQVTTSYEFRCAAGPRPPAIPGVLR